jgi:hypothetical protein
VRDHRLSAAPVERIRAGGAADIDLLFGTNTEETRLFLVADGTIDRVTEETLGVMAAAYGLPPEALSAYHTAYPGASAGELFSAIETGTGASPPFAWPTPTPATRGVRPTRVRLALAANGRPPGGGA